jgi:hypothetical protein
LVVWQVRERIRREILTFPHLIDTDLIVHIKMRRRAVETVVITVEPPSQEKVRPEFAAPRCIEATDLSTDGMQAIPRAFVGF